MKNLKNINPKLKVSKEIFNFIKDINAASFEEFCKQYKIKIKNYPRGDDFIGSYSNGVLKIQKGLTPLERTITMAHELSHFIQTLVYGEGVYMCTLLDHGFSGGLRHEREACYMSHLLLYKFNPEIAVDEDNLEEIYIYETQEGVHALKEYLTS